MNPRQRLLLIASATIALLALAAALIIGASSDTPSDGSTEPASAGATPPSGFDGAALAPDTPLRDFTLSGESGARVSLSSYRGDVVILTFLYAHSNSTAPLIAQQIRGALDELGPQRKLAALAVSVDPTGDTRSNVAAFLRRSSLTGRLTYLTGTRRELEAVWRAYAVVPASAGAGAYERSAFVLLLDRRGIARVEFPLEVLTPESLAHDVRKLQSGT